MLKAIMYQTVFAWYLATFVYQIGSRIEIGTFNIANVIIISVIAIIVMAILLKSNKRKKCAGCPYCNSCNK